MCTQQRKKKKQWKQIQCNFWVLRVSALKTKGVGFIKSPVTTVVVLVVERVMETEGRREGEQREASFMTRKRSWLYWLEHLQYMFVKNTSKTCGVEENNTQLKRRWIEGAHTWWITTSFLGIQPTSAAWQISTTLCKKSSECHFVSAIL